MVQIQFDLPEGTLASLRKDPASFVRELRLAAAAKWYELRLLSQERAAELAGLSRADFLDSLIRFGVSPFQYDTGEILDEVRGE